MARMTSHRRIRRHATSEAEPRTYPWPLLLIAAPAAVAIWSGWVGLGGMCGFGIVYPLPGIVPWLVINTAITLPVGVEAYGAYALGTWLNPACPARARQFAKWSGLGALAYGMLGQVAFHLLTAAHYVRAPWPVVVAVSCMPVITLGFGAALTHLLRTDVPAREQATLEAIPEAVEAIKEAIAETTWEPSAEAPLEAPQDEPREEPSEEVALVPSAEPQEEPRPRVVRLAEDQDAKRARADYRKSVTQGQPLSDRALGAKFGRGRTWGRNRITEVEEGPALTAQAR